MEEGISQISDGLRRLIGRADLCELVRLTFTFPEDGRLAGALADGAYLADALACLEDAGADEQVRMHARDLLEPFAGMDAAELQDRLRKGFTILFLVPGRGVPAFPYEAPFRFVAADREGVPSLFRSPVTLDVEKHMARAGVEARNRLKEPADSIWNELGFMGYLLGRAAECLEANEEGAGCEQTREDGDCGLWLARADAFVDEHLSAWAPAFFAKTQAEALSGAHSFGAEYGPLAQFSRLAFDFIADGARQGN